MGGEHRKLNGHSPSCICEPCVMEVQRTFEKAGRNWRALAEHIARPVLIELLSLHVAEVNELYEKSKQLVAQHHQELALVRAEAKRLAETAMAEAQAARQAARQAQAEAERLYAQLPPPMRQETPLGGDRFAGLDVE